MITRHHQTPCFNCQPQNYIRMVQNLIERCLQFHMSRDECIHTLSNNAGIQPLVTITVWKELFKENKSFFQAYLHDTTPLLHYNNETQNATPSNNGTSRTTRRHGI